MKRVSVQIEGRKVEGWAENIGGSIWIHLGGRTFGHETPKKESRRGARGAAAKSAGDVTAPMPGKINKISVQVGDKVDSGQVVLVMEAMKMEYTLKASASGAVEAVGCKAGDQVALGQVLVKIKSTEGGQS